METKVRTELCRYVRNANGEKIGCLYAVMSNGGQVNIGWSSYNADKENRPFSKAIARDIAKGRAQCGYTVAQMPYDIAKALTHFMFTVNKNMGTPEKIHVVTVDPVREFNRIAGSITGCIVGV